MAYDRFQYPPELFSQLVDVIPLLCRAKKDVFLFFRGAGMTPSMMFDVQEAWEADKNALNKFDIARALLARLNEAGDPALAARRELLRRVVEFEDFSRCWEKDLLPAKGLVSAIRETINVKDSFTRMNQARAQEADAVRAARTSEHEASLTAAKARQAGLVEARSQIFALFGENDPHRRGKLLEAALNKLFKAAGVLVAEDFRRLDHNGGVLEQVDGVIEIDHQLYLVEMKWWSGSLGPSEIGPHLQRVLLRPSVSGIFISSSPFTPAAVKTCDEFLQHGLLVLCTLQEIVALLERDGDLIAFIRDKVRAAKLHKRSFYEILQ